jgi:hypothetical protein
MANDGMTTAGTAGGGSDAGASAPVAPAAPAVDAGTANVAAIQTPDASTLAPTGGEAPPQEANPHAAFLDEIDLLGTSAAPAAAAAAGTTEQKDDKGTETSSSVAQTSGAADETTGDATSQTQAGKPENTNAQTAETEDSDDDQDEEETQEQPDPLTNWRKADPEDEAYIQNHLPKAEWKRARNAFKDAKALRTFLNPNVPAGVFVDNLARKSGMRFSELETEIFKRNAETDPVAMLGKVFESTKTPEGHSAAYQRLMDSVIETNPDYAMNVLRRTGVLKGDQANEANNSQTDISKLSDAEIDGVLESDAFKQLQDVLPEDATKLKTILDSTKALRAEKTAWEAEKQQLEAEKEQAKNEKRKLPSK